MPPKFRTVREMFIPNMETDEELKARMDGLKTSWSETKAKWAEVNFSNIDKKSNKFRPNYLRSNVVGFLALLGAGAAYIEQDIYFFTAAMVCIGVLWIEEIMKSYISDFLKSEGIILEPQNKQYSQET